MLTARLQIRVDSAGDGHFGVKRDGGTRTHKGVDYLGIPGMFILSQVDGKVTRMGFAYGDDLYWKYVQITDAHGNDHRFFYVTHDFVSQGMNVAVGTPIGRLQDITRRYPNRGMSAHCHYAIRKTTPTEFVYYNPEDLNQQPIRQLRR